MEFAHLLDAFHAKWNEPSGAGRPALMDESQAYTYAELYLAVSRCAGWLRASGVRNGDRVAIAMERSAQLAICILGVMAAGACPCPLEPKLGPEEARRRTAVAGLQSIVVDAASAHEAANAGFAAGKVLSYVPTQKYAPYWSARVAPADDAFLLFTSGSSGKPKGVLQNHRGLLSNARGVIHHTELGPGDRLLHLMPMHHTNGVNNQLFAPLLAGSCVIVANRFKAEAMPQLLARHRPTILTGVPTMYARMLPLEFAPGSLASLRMLRCGSAPITQELHRRVEEKFGLPLVVSYGLSEATCTSTMNPPGKRKIGSVGTVLEGQYVFLREGEICIAGPSLMTGYLLDGPDRAPQPPGEYLRTGDLGRFDEEGYLYITGRSKDVIIRGGENLSPNLIEEAIVGVPGVAACCVVGIPHADLGEVPVAFVVRTSDAAGQSLSPEVIDESVGAKLSRIHKPSEYIFVASLPENGTGKVDRRQLRDAVAP